MTYTISQEDSMNLRELCVEAAAKAIYERVTFRRWSGDFAMSSVWRADAEASLDAFLDTLEAHQKDWFKAAVDWHNSAGMAHGDSWELDLVAALRAERTP